MPLMAKLAARLHWSYTELADMDIDELKAWLHFFD